MIRGGRLGDSQLLNCISRILFPFILLFGFYVIFNGHISPGGGFQGGAILATGILITNFFEPGKIENLNALILIEKYTFVALIVAATLSVFTKGIPFTNFVVDNLEIKQAFLVLLNFFIGLKVSSGLIAIFTSFIQEGR